MKSIAFPNMFNRASTNIVSNYYATQQNITTLLMSGKGELFGDPYYGSTLKKFLYDQNDETLQDLLIDDIYVALCTFMPQIRVERKDIKVARDGKASVSIQIKALNKADFTTNMYNIVLLQSAV